MTSIPRGDAFWRSKPDASGWWPIAIPGSSLAPSDGKAGPTMRPSPTWGTGAAGGGAGGGDAFARPRDDRPRPGDGNGARERAPLSRRSAVGPEAGILSRPAREP